MSVRELVSERVIAGPSETVCHRIARGTSFAICGEKIDLRNQHPNGTKDGEYCAGCGRRNCATCVSLASLEGAP